MSDLNILNINEKQNGKAQEYFLNNIVSKGKLIQNIQMDILQDKVIQLIEKTMPYIENIFRTT